MPTARRAPPATRRARELRCSCVVLHRGGGGRRGAGGRWRRPGDARERARRPRAARELGVWDGSRRPRGDGSGGASRAIAARLDERTLRDILRFADGCVVGSDGIDAAEVDAPAADDGRGSPDLAPSARAAIAPQPLPPPDASGGAVVRLQLTQVALSFDADAAGGAAADATLRLVLSRVTGKLLPAAPAPSLQSTVGRSHIGAAQARASLIALRADADDDDSDGVPLLEPTRLRVSLESHCWRACARRARSSKSRRRTSPFVSRSTARLSCGLSAVHRRRLRCRRRRTAAAAAAVAARAAAVELGR